MPLRDHFHPPLLPLYPWESFHGAWAHEIMRYLNRLLPRRYLATTYTHFGAEVAADVAERERITWQPAQERPNGPVAEGAVAVQTWAPPAVSMVVPLVYPDDLEVRLIDNREDARLVAVVELVSPANKDRAETRRAFAAKCAAYLQRGVGVVVVDVVSSRRHNLHNEFMGLLGRDDGFFLAAGVDLYAVAYRPTRREETEQAEVWTYPLAVGDPLPTVPLPLLGAAPVPLELETTYAEACVASRL
jgi:hypothetical protein